MNTFSACPTRQLVVSLISLVLLFSQAFLLPFASAVESDVDLAKFKIALQASKQITPKLGQISTKAVVGEEGRYCTYLYVLEISPEELEKLRANPLKNFEHLVGSGSEFKDVSVKGFASLKSLCDGQKKSLFFKGNSAIPKELGWKQPIKGGTYIYVAALGFSNDPNLSKFAIPSRIVAVSDFIKVKVKL